MKKSMLILILAALLTACTPTASVTLDPCRGEKNCELSINSAPFYENYTESKTQNCPVEVTRLSTECEISTTETTVTTSEIQSETVCTTTNIVNEQKEKNREEPSDFQLEMTTENTEKMTENPTEFSDENTENIVEKTTAPPQTEMVQAAENMEVMVTEPEEYKEETASPECSLSDYEKALEVYNFMTVNGSGTCVQYAYQTYEICCQYGLECYFVWTENQLYGHVANAVKIDGVWYVLDTQAGCFLTENMCGFTEIVDENENHIADADIISSVRYE